MALNELGLFQEAFHVGDVDAQKPPDRLMKQNGADAELSGPANDLGDEAAGLVGLVLRSLHIPLE